MFSKSAELYDLLYSSFKDYAAESQTIAALIQELHPAARTILDIGCGTGEHAGRLAREHGFLVDGLDLDPALVEIASQKHPAGRFFCQDMKAFALPQTYDVVTCLFSSIGYVQTLENVIETLRCFQQHLAPGGMVLVEPWFPPGVLSTGKVTCRTVGRMDLHICRMSHVEIRGNVSVLTFHYLVGSAAGIVHKTEAHELGLFSVEEMQTCFARVGLAVDYQPELFAPKGLYIGKMKP